MIKKILSGALLTVGLGAFAQVVHVDYSPDFWIESVTPETLIAHGDETRMDLDGDGVNDYYFRLDHADFDSWWWCHLDTDHNNEMASIYPLDGVAPFDIPFPVLLMAGDVIDETYTWADISVDVNAVLGMRQNSVSAHEPHMVNEGDQYIGLRFDISGEFHYGWMLLNATTDHDSMIVTVKEYAYETMPNTPIITGDRGTSSIDEWGRDNGFSFFPNPAKKAIEIINSTEIQPDAISVYSVSGEVILADIPFTNTISLVNFENGMYIIELKKEDAIILRKKIIKNE